MSARLGAALAEHVASLTKGPKFVLVEGVSIELAEGMSRAWKTSMPPLAVVSDQPARFGEHALGEVSGTGLRNRRDDQGALGVVLVLCEGAQVPDRQSLSLFEALSPSLLLADARGMGLLARQKPAVALDGAARAVREAITTASLAARPSAAAVAAYLDRLAAGEDALAALPALGAFPDAAGGDRIDGGRISDNLALAARRTSDEVLKASAYPEVRARAQSVLARRPSLSRPGAAAVAADEVMAALQAGDDALLSLMEYDEAREVLEAKSRGLVRTVGDALVDYQRTLPPDGQAAALPWDRYERSASQLGRGPEQRQAAVDLLDVDEGQQRRVFEPAVRRKLEAILRDKAINASRPSSPEAGLARATERLGAIADKVRVISPRPSGSGNSRSAALQELTLACARLRLGALMRQWDAAGGDVDGLLLQPADTGDPLAAFADADLAAQDTLPPLQLKLIADTGTIQVDWKPDLDDVALLRAALLFAEAPALTLDLGQEPSLHAFCAAAPATALPVPAGLEVLAANLQHLASKILAEGVHPTPLQVWAQQWTQVCDDAEEREDTTLAAHLALTGAVTGGQRAVALSALAPLKAQWLGQYTAAMWKLVGAAEEPGANPHPHSVTAMAVARTTASQHPAYLRTATSDRALVPTSEARIWSLYGGENPRDDTSYATDALTAVLQRLMSLQPEAAGHLRCLAWGPGAADTLATQALEIIGRRVGGAVVGKVEVFCIGRTAADRPSAATLARADRELGGERDVLELRYLDDLDHAARVLPTAGGSPAVHLALVTGITDGGARLDISTADVQAPSLDEESLFAPRTWQRPKSAGRTLLMPPAATEAGQAWLRVQNAVDEGWPEQGQRLRVPEVRTGAMEIAVQLRQVHDLALWVATLDRYATRDSLEKAMGADQVAILHQERRLGGDSPLALVLSQKSGGPADRAIGRALRAARIVDDPEVASSIGTEIRTVASQGYGILALEAATSGAGINELVGHVVAFSLLAKTTTPWPLPPNCRVLLVSLDEYRHWFRSKRADLLAIALDTVEGGVHVAAIEVKARRSDEKDAAAGALDQLVQTLTATSPAAYPDKGSVASRLWLNRIAEAAYSVARESGFRLEADEIAALEAFRLGRGSLEWAGVGLVFGPHVEASRRDYPQDVASGDIVPIVMHQVTLTEELLRQATAVKLTELRTVAADAAPLGGGRVRRRPEAKATPGGQLDGQDEPDVEQEAPAESEAADDPAPAPASADDDPVVTRDEPAAPPATTAPRPTPEPPAPPVERGEVAAPNSPAPHLAAGVFSAPVLGWDASTGEQVRWHPAGPGQEELQNGHTEVWGSSGMGKTQFVMALLAQLAHHSGSHFGIADFKNDYSPETGFPALTGSKFLDLWEDGAPYNPLALDSEEPRAVTAAIIQLRDTVEEATRSFTRLGHRQTADLSKALERAYQVLRTERRWPTLKTLDPLLDGGLEAAIGDLTRYEIFREGPPLGSVVEENVVFGLSRIPGNGQTTILAAAFILSSLLLRVQDMPPVPNTIRYVAVVDEAHRVAPFRAVHTMVREGRSKGLAVLLATQQPADLPEVVATNAQTKICFGLPDAAAATAAARKLDPANTRLPQQIRTLGVGEAFVSLAGGTPRLLRMAQAWRDGESLGLPAAP